MVRAARFVSQVKGTHPEDENVPVIGGHSGATIVPLLSQAGCDVEGEVRDQLVHRIQFGGDEVVKAKDGAGSATLSMAHAGARFTLSLLRAIQGEKGVVECTFVDNPYFKEAGCDFFSSPVTLGPDGAHKIHDIGHINAYEEKLLEACLADLTKNIAKGNKFVADTFKA